MTFTLHSQARPLGLSVWRTLPCLRSGAPSLRSRLSLALPKPACKYEQSTGRAHACFAARRDSPPAEADSRRADIEREVEVVAAERDPRSDVHPAQKLFANLLKGFAVAALVVGLALSSASPALAANSGGRVGGSSFGAARSYGGSSLGGSSRSYGGSSLGSGYSGSRSAPSLSGGSTINLGWGVVPFGGYGYGYGGGYGYGAPVVSSGGGGIGFGEILVLGVLAVIAFQVISSLTNGSGESFGGEKVSVAKLQVALLGSARSLQRQLDRLADRADTTTPEGLHFVLQEAVLALLRNPEYAVYGSTKVRKENGLDSGEDAFNEVSLQERGKFKEETLVNVGGRSRSKRLSRPGGDGMQELIVVTLLVAAQGKLQLPRITSREELVTALNRLGAVREDQLMAMEVLWTPQDESDSYTRDELFMDYPELNTL